jgi:hypothetical protein
VAEADKVILGQELTVQVPHFVLTLMEYKWNCLLNNSWIVKYQSMRYKNPHVWLEVVKTLNPDTLMLVDSSLPEHDRLEVMDEVFSSQPDLTNQPTTHPDVEYFTDDSNFVW